MDIAGTHFPRLTDTLGRRFECSWDALAERFSKPVVVTDKRDAGVISFATFAGDKRSKANVESVSVLGLDYDQQLDFAKLLRRFEGRQSVVHTTHSSRLGAYRARVFRPLSRPVTAEEYSRIFRFAASREIAAGFPVDMAASDASRVWFLPCIPPTHRVYLYQVYSGPPVDVERVLASAPSEVPDARNVPPRIEPVAAAESDRGDGDIMARAAAYVAKADPAVSGQGGHRATFILAQRLVHGFGLSEADAYRLLVDWNMRCRPPWGELDLRRKVREAATNGQFERNELRRQRQ